MTTHYPIQQRERAVEMVLDHSLDPSMTTVGVCGLPGDRPQGRCGRGVAAPMVSSRGGGRGNCRGATFTTRARRVVLPGSG